MASGELFTAKGVTSKFNLQYELYMDSWTWIKICGFK